MKLTRLPFRVPRTLADLSTSWLTKALLPYLPDDASVEAVETKPIGEGGGVMGDIGIVMMTLRQRARVARAAWSPSSRRRAPLPRIVMRAIFKSESHFYNDFSVRDAGSPDRSATLRSTTRGARSQRSACSSGHDARHRLTRIKSTDELEQYQQAVCALARLHAR